MSTTPESTTFLEELAQAAKAMDALDLQEKEGRAERSAINSRGMHALEVVLADKSLPLAQRAELYLNAPDGFKNRLWKAPERETALMDLYITHLEYCCVLKDTVDVTQDVEWALQQYLQNPNSVMGYNDNIPCDAFLEEILRRNLLSFNV